MVRKLFLIISAVFLKAHLFFKRLSASKSFPLPYELKYQQFVYKPKVIHINGNFIIGGSTQLIVDLIERTSDDFYHMVVVPSYNEPLPYRPVDIHAFPIDKISLLFTFIEEQKPAFVHIHYWVRQMHRYQSYSLWYYAVFKICEELNIPVIQNINVPTAPYQSHSILHNVFVSEFVLKNHNTSNINASVIYPGSNFSHFQNNDADLHTEDSIGMVYRLDKDKLNMESIEVFISVIKQRPKTKCYIVGGGFYFNYYQERVNAEGLKDSFVFTGYVSYESLPTYYKKIGIFIAPVHDESFGQVTPFAMGMGLPVAGYDTGALSEILGYKETLVEYGNVAALSAVIVNLLDDKDFRKILGKRNQERAIEKFSVQTMIEAYRNLYSSVSV